MFDFVRNNKRLLQGFLLVLIIPSFVLVGVDSYQNRGDSAAGVASVDGRKITQQEWDDAQRKQIDQARRQMGPQFDQKAFETPEAKREVLDNLVAEQPAPISQEFEIFTQEQRLGVDFEVSLSNMEKRIPMQDFRMLTTALRINREVGGNDIKPTLREDCSVDMRLGESASAVASAMLLQPPARTDMEPAPPSPLDMTDAGVNTQALRPQ